MQNPGKGNEVTAPPPARTRGGATAAMACVNPAQRLFSKLLRAAGADTAVAVSACLVGHGRPPRARYPFGNPVSIESSHLAVLAACGYVVAEKSDGVRAAVVLCTDAHGRRHAAVMDRSATLFGLPLVADAALFEDGGTVLDAEVVATADAFHVLVFDAAALGSMSALPASLLDRLALLRQAVPHMSMPDGTLPGGASLTFAVKPMWAAEAPGTAAAIEAHCAALPHATDGFVLTPAVGAAPPPGTCPSILKIKAQHTVDCLWVSGFLWYGDERSMHVVEIPYDKAQLAMVPPNTVVEMAPQADKSGVVLRLHLHALRQDKTEPNSAPTFERTMASIRDAVTLEAALAAASARQQPSN